jgi:hypothetical protein
MVSPAAVLLGLTEPGSSGAALAVQLSLRHTPTRSRMSVMRNNMWYVRSTCGNPCCCALLQEAGNRPNQPAIRGRGPFQVFSMHMKAAVLFTKRLLLAASVHM